MRHLHSYSKNQKKILSLIINERGCVRARLAELSGFSLLTVLRFVNQFIDDGIVTENSMQDSTGGRRAGVLTINPRCAYVLSADIGAGVVRIGVLSLDGQIVEKSKRKYYRGIVPVETISAEELATQLSALCETYGHDRIAGVGIGLSGIVDSSAGRVMFCPNIAGYDNTTLGTELSERLYLPVMLNTSARCMALAEQRFGAGYGVKNQVFVSVGYSVSAGIVINGTLFSGAHGFSGEIGHLPVAENGTFCSCGNVDCIETYVTLPNIRQRVIEKMQQNGSYSVLRTLIPADGEITVPLLCEALNRGDKQVLSVLSEACEELGRMLVSIVNIINPELIVLGGGFFEAFPGAIAEIDRFVRKNALITNQQALKITRSVLGLDAGLIGGAIQIVNHLFGA